MIDVTGDLWEHAADARVVTTNGVVRTNGNAVMGAGCALQARERYCDLQRLLGQALTDGGNHVYAFFCPQDRIRGRYEWIVSFPVKNHWRDLASFDLIERSVLELIPLVEHRGWKRVVMPRPGVGAGGRNYSEVRPLLAPLDDRFHVITFD